MAQTRFNFTGTISFPKKDAKRPFVKEMEKDGRKMLSMNFGIKESDHNMGFVEAFDGEQKTIKTMNSDNEKIEISWNDRFDEDVVLSVASYKKTTVDLGEEFGGRHKFITMYDAIEYLKENLPKYNGKVTVTGQMVKEPYKGKYYDKFKFQSVYAVADDKKNRLLVTADVYYNKDSVDKADWKSEKKILIDGYIPQYINKDEGTKFIPQQFVFNASKYDENNEKHKKLLDCKLKYINITKKNMMHILWECVLLNGTETVEFDESQLTKAQREQIELGIRTLDDFRPAGSIFGERITEYRLFDPKLVGDFADGLVDSEMTPSEFEDEIYVLAADEKLEDVVKEAEKKADKQDDKSETKVEEIEEDDLF